MVSKTLIGAGLGGLVGAGYGYYFIYTALPPEYWEEERRIKIRNTLLYGSIGAIGGAIIGSLIK